MAADDELRVPLNSIDRVLFIAYEAFRASGYPGYPLQMLIWLHGRVDANCLRAALARLSRRYPMLTSRIVNEGPKHGVYWRCRVGQECPLEEVDLNSSDEARVTAHAESLLAEPMDLERADPIRFQLVHLLDGRDVFIVQYDHTFLYPNSIASVVAEIDRLAREPCGEDSAPVLPDRDEVLAYLSRSSWLRRWKSAARVVMSNIKQGKRRPVTLMDAPAEHPGSEPWRLLFRRLSVEQTEAFRNRVVGYFGLSALASVFRSLHHVTPQAAGDMHQLSASLVYMMRPADLKDLVLRSIGFNVILSVTPRDLGDREELTRILVQQVRDRMSLGAELGVMQLAALAARRPRMARRRLMNLVSKQLSLIYGYFVSPSGLTHLCDVRIARAYHVTSVSAPPGFAVVVHECCGRLFLAITHSSKSVPRPVAEEFIDAFIEDLL